MEAREKVEKLYVYLQVYHSLHCAWWNWPLIGSTVSMSATAVLGMYVGLRHPELPWYLWGMFWVAGLGVLVQIFGVAQDIMSAKKDAKKLVKKLQSPTSMAMRKLPFGERKRALKRSKAMRSLQFRIASFTSYTWAVPMRAWDEILKQLLFFLSL